MSFRKVPDHELPKEQRTPCPDPSHNPPGMIVLEPGVWEWTCPSCGNVMRVHQTMVTC